MFMMQRAAGIIGSGAGASLSATDFDGSSGYLSRASDFTGNADSSTGIISFWFRLDGGNAANQFVLTNVNGRVVVRRNTSNTFVVFLSSGAGTLTFQTSATHTSSSTWKHFLASWDTNFSAGNKVKHLYISDVSDLGSVTDASAAFSVDYTDTSWTVGADSGPSSFFNGCFSEIYFAPGQFLDFSVQANRRKFITSVGRPEEIGAAGATPTGVAPILYLRSPALSFGDNSGTGGNMTINGSLDPASSLP